MSMKKFALIMFFMFALAFCSYANNVNAVDNKTTKEHVENVYINTLNIDVPANVHVYTGERFRFSIKSNNEYIEKRIRYSVQDSTFNIWLDNISNDDLVELNPNNLRIAIMLPNEVDIKTNKRLLITSKSNKKKNLTNNENI